MTLDDLYATILARKAADPDSSWTAQLLAKGPEKCAEKFGEEAIEAIIEAVKDDKAGPHHQRPPMCSTTCSSCSPPATCRCRMCWPNSHRRQSQSGIAEKASR